MREEEAGLLSVCPLQGSSGTEGRRWGPGVGRDGSWEFLQMWSLWHYVCRLGKCMPRVVNSHVMLWKDPAWPSEIRCLEGLFLPLSDGLPSTAASQAKVIASNKVLLILSPIKHPNATLSQYEIILFLSNQFQS